MVKPVEPTARSRLVGAASIGVYLVAGRIAAANTEAASIDTVAVSIAAERIGVGCNRVDDIDSDHNVERHAGPFGFRSLDP